MIKLMTSVFRQVEALSGITPKDQILTVSSTGVKLDDNARLSDYKEISNRSELVLEPAVTAVPVSVEVKRKMKADSGANSESMCIVEDLSLA
eukprot:COSAG01_NODE_2469_length_7630_cov_3.588555_7_plen_92_part_00